MRLSFSGLRPDPKNFDLGELAAEGREGTALVATVEAAPVHEGFAPAVRGRAKKLNDVDPWVGAERLRGLFDLRPDAVDRFVVEQEQRPRWDCLDHLAHH